MMENPCNYATFFVTDPAGSFLLQCFIKCLEGSSLLRYFRDATEEKRKGDEDPLRFQEMEKC